MPGHGGGIAQDDELHTGTGDGHIHAAQVTQEADLTIVVGTDKRDQDDVAFLSLEAINGVHTDQMAVGFEVLLLLQLPAQILHLSAIG